MSIFKIMTTLAITFVALAVLFIVIMNIAINPHILATVGLVAGCTVKIFKRK